MLIKDTVLSPIIMVQWNIAGYFLLKVASSIADIPNFSLSPWEEEIPAQIGAEKTGSGTHHHENLGGKSGKLSLGNKTIPFQDILLMEEIRLTS